MDGFKEIKKGLELRGHRIFADVRKDIIGKLRERKIPSKTHRLDDSTSCLIEVDSTEDDIGRILGEVIQR